MKQKTSRSFAWNIVIAVGLLFTLAACGSSGSGQGVSLDGEWRGTWTSSRGQGGSVSATFEQVGEDLSGTMSLTGSPCLTNGTITGTSRSDGATFGAVQGAHQITFTSRNPSPNQITGTYSVGAGFCMGDTGQFDVTRVR